MALIAGETYLSAACDDKVRDAQTAGTSSQARSAKKSPSLPPSPVGRCQHESRKDPIVWDVFPFWNTLAEPLYYEEADQLFTPQVQGLVSEEHG